MTHRARIDITRFSTDYRFTTSTGLFPSVFNIAEGADIFVNATCGGGGSGVGSRRSNSGDSSEARERDPVERYRPILLYRLILVQHTRMLDESLLTTERTH